jgi:hypothetical protein
MITESATFELTDFEIENAFDLTRAALETADVKLPAMTLSAECKRLPFGASGKAHADIPDDFRMEHIAEAFCLMIERTATMRDFDAFDLMGMVGDMLPDMLSARYYADQERKAAMAAKRPKLRLVD